MDSDDDEVPPMTFSVQPDTSDRPLSPAESSDILPSSLRRSPVSQQEENDDDDDDDDEAAPNLFSTGNTTTEAWADQARPTCHVHIPQV